MLCQVQNGIDTLFLDSSLYIPYMVFWLNVCDKEHLVLRNNFKLTKKFLITKFDCICLLNYVRYLLLQYLQILRQINIQQGLMVLQRLGLILPVIEIATNVNSKENLVLLHLILSSYLTSRTHNFNLRQYKTQSLKGHQASTYMLCKHFVNGH